MKAHIVAISIGLTWLLTDQTARAQSRTTEDADSAKAAIRFQQGVELYREGSYEGALAEFRKAYQISPSFRVLYNIAQAQYALHDYVGADKSLMHYLTEGGGDITADRRVQVDEMSAKLGERIARVQISTNLSGADIRVDDISVGTSPLPGPIPVNVGTRKVSALKSGSPAAIRVLTVAGKESVKVDLHIDEPIVISSPLPSKAVSGPSPSLSSTAPSIMKSQGPSTPSRAGLIASLSTTAALAVATGVCGYLALNAQKDLQDQVNSYPNTSAKIENARTKSKNLAYLTDGLGAATLISGGVALYFAVTRDRGETPPKPGKADESFVVVPTLGGLILQGSF